MKIYTKTGDAGSTATFAGKRIDKDSLRIKSYGEVDELNSVVGEIIAQIHTKFTPGVKSGLKSENTQDVFPGDLTYLRRKLIRIQNELFVLQSDLATSADVKIKIPRITSSYATRLEKEIDSWQKHLPELRNFILPGGGEIGAKLHVARTVARRAERSVVSLSKQEKLSKHALSYINRLSDWFFVLARWSNLQENIPEVKWMGRKKLN